MTMEVQQVPPEHLDFVWPDVEPFIALTEDEESPAKSVYNNVKLGSWTLWLGLNNNKIEMVMTTSFVTYPASGMMCRVETLAGSDLKSWTDTYLNLLEDWAKSVGCVAMDIFGRKGFEKALAPYGYEYEATLLRKQL